MGIKMVYKALPKGKKAASKAQGTKPVSSKPKAKAKKR